MKNEWLKLILLIGVALMTIHTFYKVIDFIREEHRLDRETMIIITKLENK